MAKIQARNVDDTLYELIQQSAMKNERTLEGEIRYALSDYYRPVTPENGAPALSLRERWQRETGARLQWLFDRLISDNWLQSNIRRSKADIFSIVRLARWLDEPSPARLLECVSGEQELSFGLADRIAREFNTSVDWLISDEGEPFPVRRIGNGYRDFFMQDGQPDDGLVFEMIRIEGGRHDGTLLCLRYSPESPRNIELGVVTEQFKLAAGMGGTGHANLKAFLMFLKSDGEKLAINAFNWTPDKGMEDFDFWSVFGQHHPVYFQNTGRRTSARWLQQVLNGEDPGGWFEGWTSSLDEIRNTGNQASTE
ncbi:hypothetical protein EL09_22550 [Salmonella enterica subsp. enterica]|nr:hypothetical protein [Salmonella enterica subsp. enterica]MIF52452.1 hypothetical protein [Salmonella enterica subsp. enterica]